MPGFRGPGRGPHRMPPMRRRHSASPIALIVCCYLVNGDSILIPYNISYNTTVRESFLFNQDDFSFLRVNCKMIKTCSSQKKDHAEAMTLVIGVSQYWSSLL